MEAIQFSIHNQVATLTLNRPAQRNAFDDVMKREMVQAVRRVQADRDVRALVIGGTAISVGAAAAGGRPGGTGASSARAIAANSRAPTPRSRSSSARSASRAAGARHSTCTRGSSGRA